VDADGSSAASAQASATTQAASSGNGISTTAWYEVTLASNGDCLDDAGGGTANGTVLQEYACNNGAYNQEWQFRTAATAGYYQVFNRYATALVWDNTGGSTSNGNKIQMYTGYSGDANQEWQPVSLGSGLWKFVNLGSGLCLDATSAPGNGVQLQQWACTSGDTAQEFKLVQMSN